MGDQLRQVGEYQVLETLGSGAAGSAYRAKHLTTGDMVAIKLMHEKMSVDPDIQNRFVREVSVLQKLEHPNIVRYVDCGIDEGRIYLAMEWVEFGSLDEVLKRRGRLPWREAVECAAQICDGLQHAHERDIIHRDLKPANLFLSADGLVKIGDFGLARDADLHRLTMSGNTVGSCRYMAPEQVRGEDVLSGAVDLYAVGCLLFRMVIGRVPYDGATIIEIFEHHLYTEVPALDRPTDDRPAALDELIQKLLVKASSERPGQASEVRQALLDILAGEKVREEFTSIVPQKEIQNEADSSEPSSPKNLTERMVQGEPNAQRREVKWGTFVVIFGLLAILALIVALAQGR